jgi:uncharacterized protein YndB with AHSA1/START domain
VQFTVTQFLPATPRAVWPFITVPALMNRWSTAKIRLLAHGDGDDAWAEGTLRNVTIRSLGRKVASFDEVVQVARPPERFVYRVVHGVPLRHHRGEITLRAVEGGTELSWTVALEFPLPGMAFAARHLVLERELRESLHVLAKEVVGAPEAKFPAYREIDEAGDLPSLYAAAEEIFREQRALADLLQTQGDPKRWFARVYQFVTRAQIDACHSGEFAHPAWVLRLVPRFHFYFAHNLEAWRDGDVSCEKHWASSFLAMDKAREWKGGPVGEIAYGIAKGMQAHIEEDLPRTLAEIYHWYYRDKCRYGRFRADYLLMGPIFRKCAAEMLDYVPAGHLPLPARLFERHAPPELKDGLMARYYYDIGRERRKTFERGERLANLMAGADRPGS